MDKFDKGWEFLTSDDRDSPLFDDDGSDGYIDDDGSAEYNGADGSWGYIDKDGTGEYHASDGSWGEIDLHGTSTYYGADGDIYFKENDDYDEVEEKETSGDDTAESLSETIGSVIGIGIVGLLATSLASAINKSVELENRREEKKQAKKEKRKTWRRTHRKGIVITNLIILMALIFTLGFFEYHMSISLTYSSEALEGLDYSIAVEELKNTGFSFVYTKEIADLPLSKIDEENMVTKINILFFDSFNANAKFPSNFPVRVVYHTIQLLDVPLSSKEVKGMDFQDVVEKFEESGYANITTEIKYDIITGWKKNDGEVESVIIGGKKKFSTSDQFRPDSEIVITYHSLRKNKNK